MRNGEASLIFSSDKVDLGFLFHSFCFFLLVSLFFSFLFFTSPMFLEGYISQLCVAMIKKKMRQTTYLKNAVYYSTDTEVQVQDHRAHCLGLLVWMADGNCKSEWVIEREDKPGSLGLLPVHIPGDRGLHWATLRTHTAPAAPLA